MRTASLLLLALVLSGCASQGVVTGLKPVCDAMIGPITYSSTNKASTRFAGRALVPRLKQHNQVGHKLNCW